MHDDAAGQVPAPVDNSSQAVRFFSSAVRFFSSAVRFFSSAVRFSSAALGTFSSFSL